METAYLTNDLKKRKTVFLSFILKEFWKKMKQGNNPKNRTFVRNFNNNGRMKPSVNRNTVLESSGPAGKIRGNAFQLSEKYMAAGKDAMLQNDRVLAEICYQYADYYHRLHMNAVRFEEGNKQNMQVSSQIQESTEEKTLSDVSKQTEQSERQEGQTEKTVVDDKKTTVSEVEADNPLSLPSTLKRGRKKSKENGNLFEREDASVLPVVDGQTEKGTFENEKGVHENRGRGTLRLSLSSSQEVPADGKQLKEEDTPAEAVVSVPKRRGRPRKTAA